MNSQKAAWKYYMVYESTSRLQVRRSHTFNIIVSFDWNRACGPAILVHSHRTELQSPVVKLEFNYMYLGTAVLVSVNTKIETYKVKTY
jgi:hypothetical protein